MQEMTFTHGSLFSGSGGFDQAAYMVGIESRWQSEIEPYPIRVLKKNFPDAVQLGDISRIDGSKVEAVDVISGGSPCQDMSIAGKRAGLDGERSTLFHEQIRIIKEMRRKTDGRKPRFMVWENVPGAFSSNNGEDFRSVLEEIVSIAEPNISIPRPPWGGKWSYAGTIMGDGYSVAWRILDAQYWGVPQRRRRIYLVADFGGESAPKILFEQKGVPWNPSEGRNQRKDAAGSPADSTGETSRDIERECCIAVENHSNDSRVQISPDGMVQTLTSRMGTGGGNVPLLMEIKSPQAFGIGSYHSRGMLSDNPDAGYYEAETSRTIDTSGGDPTRHQGGIAVVAFEPGAASRVGGHVYEDGKTGSLRARAGDNQQSVAIPIEGNGARPSHFGAGFSESDKMYTLNATEQHAVAYAMNGFRGDYKESNIASTLKQRDYKDATDLICENTQKDITYIVRRLTPLECCRLQGFPDDWTDGIVQEDIGKGELQFWMDVWLEHWAVVGRGNGIKHPKNEKAVRRWLSSEAPDSDQYKLWGNGIALPCAYFVFSGIKEILDGSAV